MNNFYNSLVNFYNKLKVSKFLRELIYFFLIKINLKKFLMEILKMSVNTNINCIIEIKCWDVNKNDKKKKINIKRISIKNIFI